ncbi:MAG: hypothetical protein D6707_04615, partial [Bacteroidetes bacterium]
PKRFAELAQHLIELAYTVLYLDYDYRFGFRKRETIDLWWRGISNNSELMLLLSRFIANSPEWGSAKIRILLVNDLNIDNRIIRNKIQNVLDDYRIEAEIKIINNHLDPKPFYEHMKIHSLETDLVMVGIPAVKPGKEEEFVEKTNQLVGVIGTTLLVKASSHFNETDLGLKEHLEIKELVATTPKEKLYPLETAVSESVNLQIKQLDGLFEEKVKETFTKDIDVAAAVYFELFNELESDIHTYLETKKLASTKDMLAFVEAVKSFAEQTLKDDIESVSALMREHIKNYKDFILHQLKNQPVTLSRNISESDIVISENDSKDTIRYKKRLKFYIKTLGKKNISIQWKQLFEHTIYANLIISNKKHFSEFGIVTGKVLNRIEDLIQTNTDLFYKKLKEENANMESVFKEVVEKLKTELQTLRKQVETEFSNLEIGMLNVHKKFLNELILQANRPEVNYYLKKHAKLSPKKQQEQWQELFAFPPVWKENSHILIDLFEYSLSQIRLIILVNQIYLENIAKVRQLGIKGLLLSLKEIRNNADNFEKLQQALHISELDELSEINIEEIYEGFREKITDSISSLPSEASLPDYNWINNFQESQFETPQVHIVDLQKFSDYVLETKYFEPVKTLLTGFFKNVYNTYSKVMQLSQLLKTNIESSENVEEHEIKTLKERLVKEADKAINTIQHEFDLFINRLTDISQETVFHLDLYTVIENSENIKQYVKSAERKKGVLRAIHTVQQQIEKIIGDAAGKIDKTITRLQLAEQQVNIKTDKLSYWNTVVNQYNAVVKHPELPFYYYQLFTGKHLFEPGKYKSFKEFEQQIKNYYYLRASNPAKSALLLTGDALSGKSFWADYAAKHVAVNSRIIRINFHIQYGFEEILQQHTKNVSLTVENLPLFVPQGTTFIFNDIEKWLNKPDDFQKIMRFIKQHGEQYFVILTCGTLAAEYLKKKAFLTAVAGLELTVPAIIEKELSELLYGRHKIGAVELLNEKDKYVEKPSDIKNISRKIYLKTKGNVGLSMIYWLSSIEKVEEGVYQIKEPADFDLPHISSGMINTLLYQITLSRQIEKHRVAEIFKNPEISDLTDELLAKNIMIEPYKEILEPHVLIRVYLEKILS